MSGKTPSTSAHTPPVVSPVPELRLGLSQAQAQAAGQSWIRSSGSSRPPAIDTRSSLDYAVHSNNAGPVDAAASGATSGTGTVDASLASRSALSPASSIWEDMSERGGRGKGGNRFNWTAEHDVTWTLRPQGPPDASAAPRLSQMQQPGGAGREQAITITRDMVQMPASANLSSDGSGIPIRSAGHTSSDATLRHSGSGSVSGDGAAVVPLPSTAAATGKRTMGLSVRALTAMHPLYLTFSHQASEAEYRRYTLERGKWAIIVAQLLLLGTTLYPAIKGAMVGAGADTQAMQWLAACGRIAFVVAALCILRLSARRQTRAIVLWWSPLAGVISAAYSALWVGSIWACQGSGLAVSGCAQYSSNSYVPFTPFAALVTLPWLLKYVAWCTWVDTVWATLPAVVVTACAVFLAGDGAEVGFGAGALAYIVANYIAAVLSGWWIERADRRGYASSIRMARALALAQAQVAKRRKAEAQARRLQQFMDAAGQVVFDAKVVYPAPVLPPPPLDQGQGMPPGQGSGEEGRGPESAAAPPNASVPSDLLYQYASSAAAILYGRPSSAVKGTSFFTSIHSEDRQAVVQSFLATCRRVESAAEEEVAYALPWIARYRRLRPALQKAEAGGNGGPSLAGVAQVAMATLPAGGEMQVHPSRPASSAEGSSDGHGTGGTGEGSAHTSNRVTFSDDDGENRVQPTAAQEGAGDRGGGTEDDSGSEVQQEVVWVELVGYLTFDTASPGRTALLGGLHSRASQREGSMPLAVSLFGTERNVTSEIAAREAMEKENEGKAAASAAIDAAQKSLAFAAHELRGPLHSISASLELLSDSAGSLPLEGKRDLDSAMEGTTALRVLVDDILDSSKLRTGAALTIVPTKVDIRRLLENVAHQHESFAIVPLILEAGGNISQTLLADGTRLRQMLTNGITNAAKHTFEGCIQIRAVVKEELPAYQAPPGTGAGTPEEQAAATDPRVGRRRYILRVEIVDTGGGLRDADPEKLFVEYAQGPSAAHARGGGTGLGLPIVRKIALALGGACGINEEERNVPKVFLGATIRSSATSDTRSRRMLQCPSLSRALQGAVNSMPGGQGGGGPFGSTVVGSPAAIHLQVQPATARAGTASRHRLALHTQRAGGRSREPGGAALPARPGPQPGLHAAAAWKSLASSSTAGSPRMSLHISRLFAGSSSAGKSGPDMSGSGEVQGEEANSGLGSPQTLSPANAAAVLGTDPDRWPTGPYVSLPEGYAATVPGKGGQAVTLIMPGEVVLRRCTVFWLEIPVLEEDQPLLQAANAPNIPTRHMTSPTVPLSRPTVMRVSRGDQTVGGGGLGGALAIGGAGRGRRPDFEGAIAARGSPHPSAQSSVDSPTLPRRLPARCLLVDDNVVNRRLTGRMLERLGVTHVELAEDGVACMERMLSLSQTNRPPASAAAAGSSSGVDLSRQGGQATGQGAAEGQGDTLLEEQEDELSVDAREAAMEVCHSGRTPTLTPALRMWLSTHPCPYDMLLLDVHLPRKGGDVVVAQLRALGFSRFPIIAVTGVSDGHEVARLFSVGFDRVLAKPFDSRQLVDAMSSTLAQIQEQGGKGGEGSAADSRSASDSPEVPSTAVEYISAVSSTSGGEREG